jgi:hypothetical protein
MKLLLQSAIIFFGTLMAAGLVALGEPTRVAPSAGTSPAGTKHAVNNHVTPQRSSMQSPVTAPPVAR